MAEPSRAFPISARRTDPVVHQDRKVDIVVGDPCPIVNPSFGKKSLTRAEAYELIETLARGLRVIDGN